MSQKKRNLFYIVTSVALIALDQVSKMWARSYLRDTLHTDVEPLDLVGGWLRIYYVENTGAFLGLGDDWPNAVHLILFSILPLVFLSVFFFLVLRRSSKYSNWQFSAFTLFFAGGIGNIIDRIVFDRHVTDFMIVGIPGSWHTGIFNVADMYVTTAAGILIVLALLPKKKGKAADQPDQSEAK